MVTMNLHELETTEQFVTPFPVRRFSVAEYDAMGRAGILDESDNVELLEGWIAPKMTKNPFHEYVIRRLTSLLDGALPPGYHARAQAPVSTTDSEPEPDLAVVTGEQSDYFDRHPAPSDVVLVIEISESSLSRDRLKRRIYARAGIANYWIVNLVDLRVEAYSVPVGGEDASYLTGIEYSVDDMIGITLNDGVKIELALKEFLTRC